MASPGISFVLLDGLRSGKQKTTSVASKDVNTCGTELEQEMEAARQLLESGTLDAKAATELRKSLDSSEKLLEKHNNPLMRALRCG